MLYRYPAHACLILALPGYARPPIRRHFYFASSSPEQSAVKEPFISSTYLVLDTSVEMPESLHWSLYWDLAITWASCFHSFKIAVGFSIFSWKQLQAYTGNPVISLNQLCL